MFCVDGCVGGECVLLLCVCSCCVGVYLFDCVMRVLLFVLFAVLCVVDCVLRLCVMCDARWCLCV